VNRISRKEYASAGMPEKGTYLSGACEGGGVGEHSLAFLDFFRSCGFSLDRFDVFVYIHHMMFAKALTTRRMHVAAWLIEAVAEGGSS